MQYGNGPKDILASLISDFLNAEIGSKLVDGILQTKQHRLDLIRQIQEWLEPSAIELTDAICEIC